MKIQLVTHLKVMMRIVLFTTMEFTMKMYQSLHPYNITTNAHSVKRQNVCSAIPLQNIGVTSTATKHNVFYPLDVNKMVFSMD